MTPVNILFRYATPEDFFAAMQELGIPCNPAAKDEEQLAHCAAKVDVTHQGIIRMVQFLEPEQLVRIPDVLTPTFVIDWRSDEIYEDAYFPSYTADSVDTDGKPIVVTVHPGVFS